VKYLGEAISKCITLTSLDLDLSENIIDNNGAKFLGEGISKCSTLISLNLFLFNNSISENGIK